VIISVVRLKKTICRWSATVCTLNHSRYFTLNLILVLPLALETGGLFRLAVKLMQASSPNKTDYIPLVDCIGMVFQIRDDYLNLRSSKYQDNKGYCEDLTEGKFSYPIIHSIRHDPGNMQIINILKQRTEKHDVKKYAVQYMEKTKSFAYTREKISALDLEARRLIASFGGNPNLVQILDKLVIDDSS
jgi:geranylgeranyl diphosphate synthase type 3